MTRLKAYSELTFADDFMFCKILTSKPELCKELLGLILEIKIRRIEFPEAQKSIEHTYDGRGIRLDVYVEDDTNTVYDVEMQTTKQNDLPKRTRYYQGMIDLNLIQRGSRFKALKKSYIIFICLSDPFGKNLPVYTFESRCQQDTEIILGDDTYKVIINAGGKRDGLSDEMSYFLDFLQGKESNGVLSGKLNASVKDAIERKEWEVDYMTLQMKIQDEREDAAHENSVRNAQALIKLGKLSLEDIAACIGLSLEEVKALAKK